jgi:hypothetical protein
MTKTLIRLAPVVCLALMGLAGCDSSITDDAAQIDDYNELANSYNDLRADVQAMRVAGAEMPTIGSATYRGYATVLADTAIDTALLGEARITADFSRSTLTGNLNNFIGTVNGSDYAEFNGSLGITGGRIGVTTPGSLTAAINGSLNANGDVVTINGGLRGNFRTDGAINAAGITAADTTATDFIVNGRGVDGDIGIVAIR